MNEPKNCAPTCQEQEPAEKNLEHHSSSQVSSLCRDDPRSNAGALGLNAHNQVPTEFKGILFVRYLDHVLYHQTSALVMKPKKVSGYRRAKN